MLCGARLYDYYMTRRAVLPKSNTGTGTLGRIQTTYRFCTLAVFNLEFLEICEFVWPNRIFLQVFRLFLSIRGAKSRNEFETKALTLNHGGVT